MPAERLQQVFAENGVSFEARQHDRAVTAQELAAAEHTSGWHVAKPVLVSRDGELAMIVVPAAMNVDLERAREALGANQLRLASESEFTELFDDCEDGAEPPFGDCYGIPTYVDERLLQESEIVFAAGSHDLTATVSSDDYVRLVDAKPVQVGVPTG